MNEYELKLQEIHGAATWLVNQLRPLTHENLTAANLLELTNQANSIASSLRNLHARLNEETK